MYGVRHTYKRIALEDELVLEADQKHLENVDACSRRDDAYYTTASMYGPGCHYHRRSVMEAAIHLVDGLAHEFKVLVFPCCGFAVTETLVMEGTCPRARAIFMDRHVDRRVRRRREDVEAASFLELADIVRGLGVSTLVVGINSMVSDPHMRLDPGFPVFVDACVGNEHVHRDAVLAWMDGMYGGCGSRLLPLHELATFVVN